MKECAFVRVRVRAFCMRKAYFKGDSGSNKIERSNDVSDLIVDEKLPLLKPVKVSVCVRSLAVACTYAHTHFSLCQTVTVVAIIGCHLATRKFRDSFVWCNGSTLRQFLKTDARPILYSGTAPSHGDNSNV